MIIVTEIEDIILEAGLIRIKQFYMQGVGLIQDEDKVTFGFGTNRFAIMCEKKDDLLENIWVTGHTDTEEEKQKLINTLELLGKAYNFIAVNWYAGKYYNLIDKESAEDFVKTSF